MNTTQQHVALLLLLSGCSVVLLGMTCYTHETLFGALFLLSLCVSVGFYSLQSGILDSFTLKGLSAEASFIRTKKQEVEKNAEEVAQLKTQVETLLDAAKEYEDNARVIAIALQTVHDRVTETMRLAEPPTLTASILMVDVVDAGLRATIRFLPSKNEPLGIITFDVSLTPDSEARIVDLWPANGGAFQSGKDSKKIDQDGSKARLAYSLLSAGTPEIDITVSNECRVTIVGNYCEQATVIDIKTPPAQSANQDGE